MAGPSYRLSRLALWLLHAVVHLLRVLRVLVASTDWGIKHNPERKGTLQSRGFRPPPLRYVAVVVAEEPAKPPDTQQLSQLLLWLLDSGVKEASLYDPAGLQKGMANDIAARLCQALEARGGGGASCRVHLRVAAAEGVRQRQHVGGLVRVGDAGLHSGPPDLGGREGGSPMVVHLLSASDASSWLVHAAAGGGGGGMQVSIPEALDAHLSHLGGSSFEPELLLVFGASQALSGYPPWQTRLTEIYHMGHLEGMTWERWQEAVQRYGKTMQRCGT